jgi:hypothetical protein
VLCTGEPISSDEAGDFSEVLVKPYPFEQLLTSIFGQRGARWPAQSTRVGRRARCGAGRAFKSPRGAPRAWRHPE